MKEYRILIDASGPGGSKIPPKKTWDVSGGYIAYRESGGRLVEAKGLYRIEKVTEEHMRDLQMAIKPYSVIRVKANRVGAFFIHELLEADAEPLEDEEAYFKQYKTPVVFNDEQYGKFVLNRQFGGFEGSVNYKDETISVILCGQEDIKTLDFICKDLDKFIKEASLFAAQKLLELGNQWQEEDEIESSVPLTKEDFAGRISLNEISIDDDLDGGRYCLWFNDDGIFWGHSVTVIGSIKSGFEDANMEG